MAQEYVPTASSARYTATIRRRMDDPLTYPAGTAQGRQKLCDMAWFFAPMWHQVFSGIERDAMHRAVRIKNTSGGAWAAGTLLHQATLKLTAQTTATATSSPSAGATVVISVAATFEVGQVVAIVSGGYTDYAIVTAVSAGVSVTVDQLHYDHTTPVVTALPAFEPEVADKANKPALWVIKDAVDDAAYGWAYDAIEVSGLDTSGKTAESLIYADASGAYTETAPTGADEIVQRVGYVKKVDAAAGIVMFAPGQPASIRKIGSSWTQSGIAKNPGDQVQGEVAFYGATADTLDTDTKLNWDATNKALVVGGTATAIWPSAGIEAWADDTMRIRAITYHASNYPRIQTFRGAGTKASPAAVADGALLGLFQNMALNTTPAWYAATSLASFCDGSPTADYVPGGFWVEVADGAGATTRSQYWRANGRVQINGVQEWGGTAFSTSADTGTICKSGRNAAPSAWTAAADTDAQDFHLRTQGGGAHAAANPRGGDYVITLGAAGSGGTGRAGHFRVDGLAGFGSTTAPSASLTDGTLFWSADRGGTAGKAGFMIRAEDGTVHCLSDYVGFGTTSPTKEVHVEAVNPSILLAATVEEDADGGRESDIIFQGEQSGGEQSYLARIRGSHDGAADDEKGRLEFYTNDGNDATSPTKRMAIDSAGGVFMYAIKSGATQGGAGAAANELWKTASHATLPDNVVMIGV